MTQVKKKKKTKRIGFGRDDDADDTTSQSDVVNSPQVAELVSVSDAYVSKEQQQLINLDHIVALSSPLEPTIQELNSTKPPPPPIHIDASSFEQMLIDRYAMSTPSPTSCRCHSSSYVSIV